MSLHASSWQSQHRPSLDGSGTSVLPAEHLVVSLQVAGLQCSWSAFCCRVGHHWQMVLQRAGAGGTRIPDRPAAAGRQVSGDPCASSSLHHPDSHLNTWTYATGQVHVEACRTAIGLSNKSDKLMMFCTRCRGGRRRCLLRTTWTESLRKGAVHAARRFTHAGESTAACGQSDSRVLTRMPHRNELAHWNSLPTCLAFIKAAGLNGVMRRRRPRFQLLQLQLQLQAGPDYQHSFRSADFLTDFGGTLDCGMTSSVRHLPPHPNASKMPNRIEQGSVRTDRLDCAFACTVTITITTSFARTRCNHIPVFCDPSWPIRQSVAPNTAAASVSIHNQLSNSICTFDQQVAQGEGRVISVKGQ